MRTLIAALLLTILSQTAANTIYLPIITRQPAPTATPTHTLQPTHTQTATPSPTDTPQPTATQTQQPAVCACTGNLYNCSDFTTQAQAQACFDHCVEQGAGDIHKLDNNDDGVACESLPLWVQVLR